jgi:hypothetical protein
MLVVFIRAVTSLKIRDLGQDMGGRRTGFRCKFGIFESAGKKPGEGPEGRLEAGDGRSVVYEEGLIFCE